MRFLLVEAAQVTFIRRGIFVNASTSGTFIKVLI